MPLSPASSAFIKLSLSSVSASQSLVRRQLVALPVRVPHIKRHHLHTTRKANMSIPSVQKAIRIHETGGPDVLKYETDVPVPTVGDNQVLINNKFAGINFIENYFRQGLYKTPLPATLGREGAGEVVKVGSAVKDFKVGDRVGYLSAGAYAQYIALNETANIYKIPDGVEYEDVAAALTQGLTALTFVHEAYEVKSGDNILIHAAAGGTGSILVQLAKLKGATVIGATSTEEKAKIAKENGVDHVIISTKEDIVERVKEITDGAGVVAVFDGVGKDTYEISLKSLARKGTFVSFGNASGPVAPISLLDLVGNIRILRPTLFNYVVTREEWGHYTGLLFQLISDKKLKINLSKIYPLEETKQALADLSSRKTTGKLVVRI